jgi:hypothetical protein
MSHDASELLGATQVAGTSVKPIGGASTQAQIVAGGLAAGIASKLLSGKKSKELMDSQTPGLGIMGLGFLAVTDQELALISMKMGAVKGKLVDVVARVPRSQVASAEMTGAMLVHLVVNFADGTRWAFEVRPQDKRDARQVVDLFGAQTVVGTS